jgi:TctA family transporter
MSWLDYLGIGLAQALSLSTIWFCFVGVVLGMVVGVLPGIGAVAAIALLLPYTYELNPTDALVMLSGVYYGSAYGGSIASILLNLPGTPSSAVACLDGYPMAQQGRAGVALFITTIGSFVGATIGILLLMAFAPAIAHVALDFRPADYFSMMLLGLIAASTISSAAPLKGIAMVILGILIGMIGTDVNSGTARYSFGFHELTDGVGIVAIAMGLFGITEVIASARQVGDAHLHASRITFRSMWPTRDDWRRSWMPMIRGSWVGSFFGALPGTGGTISAFMAYALEKRVSHTPERFGQGAIEGVTAPEAANNACDQTAFIPTLTLGVPGSVTMALMLGALMIHGIAPGPNLMVEKPELFWGLIMSFWVGNLMLLVLNIPLIGIWIRLITVPYHLLYPSVILLVCIGVYSLQNSVFDVAVALACGLLGYLLRLLDLPPAPLLLGFVLGPLMEEYLRRALVLSDGEFSVFLTRPVSAGFLAVSALLLVWAAVSTTRRAAARRSAQP